MLQLQAPSALWTAHSPCHQCQEQAVEAGEGRGRVESPTAGEQWKE